MNERILIIDDEPAVHDVLRAYLERDGYIVHSSREGRDGIAMSAASGAALLIVDLVLPDISGTVVLQEVRRHSEVPIMMLSGQASTEERIEALMGRRGRLRDEALQPARVDRAREGACCGAGEGRAAGEDVSTFDGRSPGARPGSGPRCGWDGHPRELTVTEYEILATLAHPAGSRVLARGAHVPLRAAMTSRATSGRWTRT